MQGFMHHDGYRAEGTFKDQLGREEEGVAVPIGNGSMYLDCLIGATVQVTLGCYQGPHPMVETCEFLLQLELSAHNVPDLWKLL